MSKPVAKITLVVTLNDDDTYHVSKLELADLNPKRAERHVLPHRPKLVSALLKAASDVAVQMIQNNHIMSKPQEIAAAGEGVSD